MTTIYKYELAPMQMTVLPLQEADTPLSVIEQNGTIQLYVKISDEASRWFERAFKPFPTGVSSGPPWPEQFIGTVKLPDGTVWHVFEVV